MMMLMMMMIMMVMLIMMMVSFYLYITYREVALQQQLIFKGPLILQEMNLISKILQKSIYNC